MPRPLSSLLLAKKRRVLSVVVCCLAWLLSPLASPGWAEDESPDELSADANGPTWVTSIRMLPASGDRPGSLVAATATGLLLRPADVVHADLQLKSVDTLYSHPTAVWGVDATSDGKTIVSVDYRGNLIVFDRDSKMATDHEKAFERWCSAIRVSPDDRFIVAGNEAGKLFRWDLSEGKVAASVELNGHSVTSIAFADSGDQIAVSDGGGQIHLMTWPELESVREIKVGEGHLWCVVYDGDRLVAGSADRHLYHVPLAGEGEPSVIAKGSDWITRLAKSPSGQIAASEVGGAVHFVQGGAVSSTVQAESGVWALSFGLPGQLVIGTRKNGLQSLTQSWSWGTPEMPAAKEETQSSEPKATESEPLAGEDEAGEKESKADDKSEAEEAKSTEKAEASTQEENAGKDGESKPKPEKEGDAADSGKS
ncbi:MAG: hypothetical protein AAGA03_01815 [Planctomycetota bacterium]